MPEGRQHGEEMPGPPGDGFLIPELSCCRPVALEGHRKDQLGPFPLCGPQVFKRDKSELKAGTCKGAGVGGAEPKRRLGGPQVLVWVLTH